MGLSAVTYALAKNYAKKYVDETAAQFGALKGANCTIESIVKQDGRSIVTFKWTNDEGKTRYSTMYVDDGTPIYNWTPKNRYNYGDIAIYQDAFYRCTVPNSDATFDPLKWTGIGTADGNYDIVQNSELLPQRYTEADRKMCYCIDDDCFFLWDGYSWSTRSAVPKASDSELGGVIVDEETINLDEDGRISINGASDEDIDALFDF